MPKTQPGEQPKDPEQHKRESQSTLIGEQVIRTLGKPDDLHNVQVRWLWEDQYRVNILVGTDAASATIANSYFVKADRDGKILRSSPKITKLY